MKIKVFLSFLVLALIFSPLLISQSRETGAIVGTITDDQGENLPGVTITLTGANLMGSRTAVTDNEGNYRFPALPPGSYSVKAELDGFTTVLQENINLSITSTLTIDLTLKPAVQEEEVTVIAVSPTIDVKSTETASVTLSEELLQSIPYSNFATDIINLAPGVSGDVAYGSSSGTGVAYQIDGVDVSDPEGGTAWVFNDPNIIDDVKVMGVGLPSEYGNFTGVIFNQVTKSGGNQFSGAIKAIYQGKKDDSPKGLWMADNNQAYIDDYPDMISPMEAIQDFSANIGGPIMKDKFWFFVGAQYYRSMWYPAGFPEAVDYKQPRFFLKLTGQITSSTNANAFFEFDAYQGENRGAGSNVDPIATVTQDSPDKVGNFSLTHILNEKTFFNIKGSFFSGYYYLDPAAGDVSAHFSINDNYRYDSAGYFYYADRNRYQANAAVTHYAEDFIAGDHDFKVGAEFEYSNVRNRYGYTGPNNRYYVDYVGYGYTGNYLAYQYEGYDTKTSYARVEEYAQDSWKVSDRLNLNLGVRLTHVWGFVKNVSGSVYSNTRIAPRLGFTYDILGDKTTIFKAHYGQFTEAMLAPYHDRLNPPENFSDWSLLFWDLGTESWMELYRVGHEGLYTMDENIKHPYMDQFVVSLERELFRDASLSASVIYRNWNNFVGTIEPGAEYEKFSYTVKETGETFTLYDRLNPSDRAYIITNINKGDPWIDVDVYRNYLGLELLFHKRFSNKWQLLASYVYGRAYGTRDNGSGDDIGWGGDTESPNYWINSEGHCTNDNTHMVKIQGTYVLPYSINFTIHFHAITGDSWTTSARTPRYGQGRITFNAEKQGSHHYPIAPVLDFRLEKTFTFAERYRVGVMADVFNVFNNDTIRSWGTLLGQSYFPENYYPDLGGYTTTEGHYLYSFQQARQFRIGVRFTF
jgi:outer membrane receptor protein involved in Fe transport